MVYMVYSCACEDKRLTLSNISSKLAVSVQCRRPQTNKHVNLVLEVCIPILASPIMCSCKEKET